MAVPLLKKTKKTTIEAMVKTWEAKPILPPELTEDLPLEDVFIGLLKEKKDVSRAIQSISVIWPGFGYLKRCSAMKLLLAYLKRSKVIEKAERPVENEETDVLSQEELKTLLKRKGFDLSLLKEDFKIIKVPARAPRTKAQAEYFGKFWPVNFHPDPSIEAMISGSIFSGRQLCLIETYMKVVIEAAKRKAVGSVSCNGSAMIVDPKNGKIVALAASQIDQHPMWHAAMLAVDLTARLQGGGAWNLNEISREKIGTKLETVRANLRVSDVHTLNSSVESESHRRKKESAGIKRKLEKEVPFCFPPSLIKISLPSPEPFEIKMTQSNKGNGASNACIPDRACETTTEENIGPYLCTGYWIFMLKEPCALCAMALLHSRVTRIFYGVQSENSGFLGSKAILHSVPVLNHRYQVWRGILERECYKVSKEIMCRYFR